MKSNEIALEYGITEYILNDYIKKHATFKFKENFWGEIIIPDDVDIKKFIQPLLEEKEVRAKNAAEKKIRQQQEEYEQKIEEQKKEQADHDRKDQLQHHLEELEQKKKEEKYHLRIEKLKAKQFDGYYEYKVISLSDASGLFKSNSGG